jgi:hypothetical protein
MGAAKGAPTKVYIVSYDGNDHVFSNCTLKFCMLNRYWAECVRSCQVYETEKDGLALHS